VFTKVSGKHTASIFYIEDEGSKFFENVDNCIEDYMVSQPRRPDPELSLL
jgi:hypothetical protein